MKKSCLLAFSVLLLFVQLEGQSQVFPSEIQPNQPTKQWGLYNPSNRNADIKAPEAWSLYRGEADNVRIYISDSGVLCRDYLFGNEDIQKHPDLRGGFYQNYRDYGWGHGTFVAGIIAALSNNGIGIASVNWNTTINQVNGLSAGGGGLVLTRENLFTAVSNGAEIINMSWGSSSEVDLGLIGVCARAYNDDVLLVGATGNEALGQLNHPSAIPSVMAVGGTNNGGGYADQYSNYGPGISVVAPGGNFANFTTGHNIYSTGVDYRKDSTWIPPQPDPPEPGYWLLKHRCRPTYKWAGGTSAAAPFVSGVAGLLKGYAKSKGITLNNDDLRRIIEITADDIHTAGYDVYTGYGKVNAYKALSMLNPPWEMIRGNSPGGNVGNIDWFNGYVPYWPTNQSLTINGLKFGFVSN